MDTLYQTHKTTVGDAINGKMDKNKRMRHFFMGVLAIELLIFFLVFPGYLGIPFLTTILTGLSNLLSWLLWPVFPEDAGTYKETIYQLCTWFTGLGLYPLIRWVAIWFAPLGILGSIVHSIWLKKRLNEFHSSKNLRHATFYGVFQFAVDLVKRHRANLYIREQKGENTGTFPSVCGIRVRLPYNGSNQETDFIIPWSSSNTISLENLGFPGYGDITRSNGQAFLNTSEGSWELTLNQPLVISHDNAGNKPIQNAVIIWIGG